MEKKNNKKKVDKDFFVAEHRLASSFRSARFVKLAGLN